MQILIRIIIPALIPIILGLFLSSIDKNNSEEIINNLTKEHIVIRLPKAYLWVGCICTTVFLTAISLIIWFPNDTATAWVWILIIFFAFAGAVIVLETQAWRIEIFRSENYFLYRTVTFKTYKIPYNNCMSYKFGSNTLVLKTKKKTFYVDTNTTNFEFLLTMLTQHKITEIK